MSTEASPPLLTGWQADVPPNADPSLLDLHAKVVGAVVAGEGLTRVAELTATAAGGPVIIVVPALGGPWVGPREHLAQDRLAALEMAVIDHLGDPGGVLPDEFAWEVPVADERLNGVVALLRTDEQSVRPGAPECLHVAALAALTEGAIGNNGTYRLLFGLLSSRPEELRSLYRDTIAPLVAYDDRYHTELVATLETYLSRNCNMNATAATMFAHRHTIAYRLERIRELTRLDPGQSEDRERLGLGLKAYRLVTLRLPQ